MTLSTDRRSGREYRGAAFGRAALGAAVMAVGLGVGTGLGAALAARLGVGSSAGTLLSAVLCSAIVVPAVLVLRVRRDRLPLSGIGLTTARTSAAAFLLGVAVTAGSAAAVFGLGTAAGWLRWTAPDIPALLGFLLLNGITAFLLEALPEELSLRGYAWTSLRERYRAAVATLVTTALFLVVPGLSTVVHAAVAAALNGAAPPVGIAPVGEDPVAYLTLLLVFGLTLISARTATASASLWTCLGTHLTFLTVNRVVLFGGQRHAGWSAEITTPDAFLLVPGYLVVAALVYRMIAACWR